MSNIYAGIERPLQMLKKLKDLKNPQSLYKLKIKGTLSLSPRDRNNSKDQELMMLYDMQELGNDKYNY